MKSLRNEFMAAAAAIALIAGSGSAYAQAEKKMEAEAQGGAKVEAQGQAGAAKKQGTGSTTTQMQGGAKTEPQSGSSGTQMQTQGGAKTGQDTQPAGQAQTPSSKDSASSERPAQLSEQQRTQIGTTMTKQSNLRRVERNSINFTINVGAVVPRTMSLAPLPAPILTLVPAYRGYLYIVVGNDLLIIHPRTYEIVAVIPA